MLTMSGSVGLQFIGFKVNSHVFECTVEGTGLYVQVVMDKVRLCETLKDMNTRIPSNSAPWTAPTPGSGLLSASHAEY